MSKLNVTSNNMVFSDDLGLKASRFIEEKKKIKFIIS